MSRRLPTALLVVAIGLVLALVVSACSSEASTRTAEVDAGPTTTAAPVALPATVPDGVTLRIGDQLDYLQTVLGLAGEDEDFPYDVEYSSFIGGPPMLQAFQGGALDTGFIGTTPLIFAQAAGQDIVAVAGWASERSAYGLVVPPGTDDIGGWEDLAGKRVAYQRGTAGEAVLLQALDRAGVDPGDITTVDVAQTQVSPTLQGGSADAGISIEPLTSAFLASNPGSAEVAGADEITDRTSLLITTGSALDDEGKTAALADYTARLVRAFRYLLDHRDLVVQAVYVDTYGLPPERAAEIVEENGEISFFALPGEVAEQQQVLADLFVAAGQIPDEIDVSAQFDTRFNDLVQQEQDR